MRTLASNYLKEKGMIGRTGAGETWPVRTQAGAWDDCYDEPYKHKDYSRHLYEPDYGLHAIGVIIDHGHKE